MEQVLELHLGEPFDLRHVLRWSYPDAPEAELTGFLDRPLAQATPRRRHTTRRTSLNRTVQVAVDAILARRPELIVFTGRCRGRRSAALWRVLLPIDSPIEAPGVGRRQGGSDA